MELQVAGLRSRIVAIVFSLGVCILLAYAAFTMVVAGVLTDQRATASRELLAAGIRFAPNSANLNARLAEAEMGEDDRDVSAIERRVLKSVNLSPWDFRLRLLLATVQEARGDRGAAEGSLQEALALAPNYTEVHWRLANLLLREGKLAKSADEFRIAVGSDVRLLPGTLDLLSRVSGGNLNLLRAATPSAPKSRLQLAQFLLSQSRVPEAITVFAGIDRDTLEGLPQSAEFIDSLVKQNYLEEARGLWVGLVSGEYAQPGHPLPLIWNGSFESEISKTLGQFDWTIGRNEYAIASIDSSVARAGSRSLRIDFTGKDTTRLDGQVKQNLVLRPGAHYRLQYYVKTERLEAPEAPRVVITDASSKEIVRSDPVPTGSTDWRAVAIDFTTPVNTRAVVIAIKRVPIFSYDNPTSGTVWFDELGLIEQSK